jgi:hypothetical protein
MNSLKQVIINAVVKVSTDPKYEGKEYGTSEEARRDFIKALIAELFPECPDCVIPGDVQSPAVVAVAEEKDGGGPVGESGKEKKKRAPKKKEAEAVVEDAAPAAEAVAEAAPEKKKRAPKKKETEAVVEAEAVVEVVAEAAPEKKKRGPKAKAETAAVNHPKKLNKTEENKIKGIAKELKVEGDVDVLAYLNGLSAEEYAAKSFEEHVRALLTPKETAVEETVAKRGLLVEFKDKDYWVDPETKKVYSTNGPVDEHIGHVGMLEFADMEIPDHLPEDLEEIVN